MPKKIEHACRYLAGNEKIAGYLGTIERNARLLHDTQRALPPPLAEHCLHAALDSGLLMLTTDSPVWSTRLRFFAPELLRNLALRYGPIASCRVRVQPASTAARAKPVLKCKLSEKTKQHLLDAAASIEDECLASALRRLANAGSAHR